MKEIPVYQHTGTYAREHGELEQFRNSFRANIACKEAIEAAIREHYRNTCLGSEAPKQVVDQFGYDRVFHVLANTVKQMDWDGRISNDNKAWAKTVPVCENKDGLGGDRNCYFVVNSHPGLTDLFLTQTRKEFALAQQQEKPSVRQKLKAPPERNAPKNSAHFKSQER